MTEPLLQHNATVDTHDNNGRTALMYVADNGHDKVTELLLQQNATVDTLENNDMTALMYAAAHGHDKVTELSINLCYCEMY